MRVAYVCLDPGVPVFGGKGCSIHVQEVLRALIDCGACIDLFAISVGGDRPDELRNVNVHEIAIDSSCELFRRERNLLAANRKVKTMLTDNGRFDVVYERHALWSHAAMEYARDNHIPGVLEVNAPLVEEQAAHRQLLDASTAKLVSSRVLDAASLIVPVSERVAEYARRMGAPGDRVHVVANGVRPERYRVPSAEDAFRDDRLHVGFVGSLRPWHGVADLIDAFGRLPQARDLPEPQLSIVGDGPQRESLEQKVASMPHAIRAKINLVGAVPYAQIPATLATFDVAVAPYTNGQDCYFSPLKVFEYMAAGLPVVAARAGQLAQIIRDEHNGLLYQAGDVEALARLLVRLWADRALRQKLGRTARRDAEAHHTWRQRVEEILTYAGLRH